MYTHSAYAGHVDEEAMNQHATADAAPTPASPDRSMRILSNPPLQEAVFEFRWALQEPESGVAGRSFPVDPFYRIATGRFYDRVISDFQKYETLPTWEMPDAIAAYVAQHRWAREAGSPILQVGPGVLTVNETRPLDYRWSDFRQTCIHAWSTLLESYPAVLQPLSLSIQYINSIPFDFMKLDAFEFIAQNLNVDFLATRRVLPSALARAPLHFQSTQAYWCPSPAGVVSIVFASLVNQQSEKRLSWHLVFESRGNMLPTTPSEMTTWLDESHGVLETLFFNMIKGNLERVFA